MSKQRFSIPTILHLAHQFVQTALERVPPPLTRLAIDATVGNGYDTAWLAECVGPEGHVVGCDIQESALSTSAERLGRAFVRDRVTFVHANHATLHHHLPVEWNGRVSAIMANLGYLPWADKSIITTKASTIAMLQNMLPLLRVGGIMTITVYSGHEGGLEEADAVFSYVHGLPPAEWRVFHAAFPNQTNCPPELLAVERLFA